MIRMLFATVISLTGTAIEAQNLHHENQPTQTQYVLNSDSADRIRYAGQLRTLTQQVAAASCVVTSGIDVEEAHAVLAEATTEFDRILDALRTGDEAMHILGPEENRRILADLDEVAMEWQAIHGAVDRVIANGQDVESAHIIDDHNLVLLELTSQLAADIAGTYTNPYEFTAADAMLIEIAGRQRMLTQKMAKDACEIWTDYHADAAEVDLRETMVIFESALLALRDGLPAMGIQAAPNDAIRADLDLLLARWDVISVNTQTLIDGGTLDEDQKTEIFHDLQIELHELDHLIEDYKEHAERHHNP